MVKKISPAVLLLPLLIIPLAFWFVAYGGTVELHVYDTYFIIGPLHLVLPLSCLVLVEAGIYFLTRRFRQLPALQNLHVAGFAIFMLGLFIFFYYNTYGGIAGPARYYLENGDPDVSNDVNAVAIAAFVALLAFAISHLAFLFNLVAGFIRGKKTPL